MLLVPIQMEMKVVRRPLVAAVLATVTVYQALLLFIFPKIMGVPSPDLSRVADLDWQAIWQLVLSLFRGAGPFAGIFLLLFWMVFGSGVEQKTGSLALAVTYLVGSLVPLLLDKLDWIALDRHYWVGLGGVMACLGLAYFTIWSEEVRFFYLMISPWRMGMGYETCAAAFIMVVLQLFLSIGQFMARFAAPQAGEPPPPPGIPTTIWVLLYPFAVLSLLVFVRKVRRTLLPSSKEETVIPSGKALP